MSQSQTIFPYEREPIYHVGTSTGNRHVKGYGHAYVVAGKRVP